MKGKSCLLSLPLETVSRVISSKKNGLLQQEIALVLRLWCDHKLVCVDVLVAIADIIAGCRTWSKITLSGWDITIVCPDYIDYVFNPIPAGIQFDVVAMERHATIAEHLTVGLVGYITNPDIVAESRIDVAGTVGTCIVYIKCLVAG